MIGLGLTGLAGFAAPISLDTIAPEKNLCYALLALITAGLRVTRTSMPGGTSMVFLFILVSLIELPAEQTLLIAGLAVVIMSPLQAQKKNRLALTLSDLLSAGAGSLAAQWAFHHPALSSTLIDPPVRYVAASAACFFAMAVPAFAIIGLTERAGERKASYSLLYTLPYYLVSGAVTGLFAISSPKLSWQSLAAYLPFAFILWRFYQMYVKRLESHRARRDEIEKLHLRTIETLSLAIGARDQEMSKHLERVQIYALEMGKALGLKGREIEGLKAAALLHDIGKLGVPEHIISKPGRLTPEEFEKMKIHPAVGAEILERAEFPYPVVPYVRHHHERWDGSGYPGGLKGEEIPIGARILTVVDCLDALASDRQYRRALAIDDAVDQIAMESGKQFDPKIISILKKNYRQWEALVASARSEKAAQGPVDEPEQVFDRVVKTIGSTSAEVNSLFELTQELGNSLNLADTFMALGSGLRRLVPYSGLAVFLIRRDKLYARHLAGEFPTMPDSVEVDLGTGLSGRVAATGDAVINGDPSRESADRTVSIYFSGFRSALALAIPGPNSVLGVLTLYHTEADAFNNDQFRKLQALLPKLSQAIENGMRFKMAEDKAGTDHLTGLPNAHSLYLHLDRELGLSRCMNTPLAVVVCDLNGFKQVNDNLGHLVGNKLLQSVGSALRESCREYDFVSRMGGDEFVMILAGVQEDVAIAKIRQLREVIRSASASVCREGTIFGSFGLAMFPRDSQTADELLTFADRNMYRDKEEQKAVNGPAFGGMRSWKATPPVPAAPIPSRARPAGSLTPVLGTD
jgi:diguanylate cyclase (GGDEF)-like protein/putative nucleotidyltransferase with HDIG domain